MRKILFILLLLPNLLIAGKSDSAYKANGLDPNLVFKPYEQRLFYSLASPNYVPVYSTALTLVRSSIYDSITHPFTGFATHTQTTYGERFGFSGNMKVVGNVNISALWINDSAFLWKQNNGFNQFCGTLAGNSSATGIDNEAFGYGALNVITNGHDNTAMGYYSQNTITSGIYDETFGAYSLYNDNTGSYNSCLGWGTMYHSIGANYNTIVGWEGAYQLTNGEENTGVGYKVLYNVTTGQWNTAIAGHAMTGSSLGITSNYGVGIGYDALQGISSGAANTAIGSFSMYTTTTGTNNTASGYSSLYYNTTGSSNTAKGSFSLFSNIGGSFNTALGDSAGYGNTTGINNIYIGYQSGLGVTTSSNQIYIGNSNNTSKGYMYNHGNGYVTFDTTRGVGGTVTNVSTNNGVAALFTTSVTNPSTTPHIVFTYANQSPKLFYGTQKSGSAVPPTFTALYASEIATSFDTTITHSNGSSGQVAVFSSANNVTSYANFLYSDGNYLQQNSTAQGSVRGLQLYQNSTYKGADIHCYRSHGTYASPTAIVAGDTLESLTNDGYDGISYDHAGAMRFIASKISTTPHIAARWVLQTSSIVSGLVDAFKADTNQNITLPAYGTGIAHFSSVGLFSSSAVNLANSDVTGVLPLANGGTNTSTIFSKGSIPFLQSGKYAQDASHFYYSTLSGGDGHNFSVTTNGDTTGTDLINTVNGQYDCNQAGSGTGTSNGGVSFSEEQGTSISPTKSTAGDSISGVQVWPYNGSNWIQMASNYGIVKKATARPPVEWHWAYRNTTSSTWNDWFYGDTAGIVHFTNAIPVASGGTGVQSSTAYGLICAGTTTTGAFQNAGAGTFGQVLVSNGSSALPSWSTITYYNSGTNDTTRSNNAYKPVTTNASMAVAANHAYKLQIHIEDSCSNLGGIKFQFTVPTSASVYGSWEATLSSSTSSSQMIIANGTLTTAASCTSNRHASIDFTGIVVVASTAGNLGVQFEAVTDLQIVTVFGRGTTYTLTPIY